MILYDCLNLKLFVFVLFAQMARPLQLFIWDSDDRTLLFRLVVQ